MSEESMLMALGFVYYASGAPRWVGACLLLPTTRDTNTTQPAYYNTIHSRTTIIVLWLIKALNKSITMDLIKNEQ